MKKTPENQKLSFIGTGTERKMHRSAAVLPSSGPVLVFDLKHPLLVALNCSS